VPCDNSTKLVKCCLIISVTAVTARHHLWRATIPRDVSALSFTAKLLNHILLECNILYRARHFPTFVGTLHNANDVRYRIAKYYINKVNNLNIIDSGN